MIGLCAAGTHLVKAISWPFSCPALRHSSGHVSGSPVGNVAGKQEIVDTFCKIWLNSNTVPLLGLSGTPRLPPCGHHGTPPEELTGSVVMRKLVAAAAGGLVAGAGQLAPLHPLPPLLLPGHAQTIHQ